MNTTDEISVPQYPMRVVVRRTGLNASLLRAWERRYGAVVPGRSDGGQRLYSEGDIRKLVLLRELVDLGHTIGQIAGRSEDELRNLLLREQRVQPDGPNEGPGDDEGREAQAGDERESGESPGLHEDLSWEADEIAATVEEGVAAIRAMDTIRLEQLLDRAAVALTPVQLTDQLIVPLLRRVGQLWEGGELGPASEHLASGVIRRFLDSLLARLAPKETGAVLLIGTPAGQRHEFGALLAGVVAAAEGWQVVPLGPDLPAAEIAEAARRKGAGAIALSALHPNGGDEVKGELQALSQELQGEVPVLVGGPAVNGSRPDLEAAGVICLTDLAELRLHLRQRGRNGGRRPV